MLFFDVSQNWLFAFFWKVCSILEQYFFHMFSDFHYNLPTKFSDIGFWSLEVKFRKLQKKKILIQSVMCNELIHSFNFPYGASQRDAILFRKWKK